MENAKHHVSDPIVIIMLNGEFRRKLGAVGIGCVIWVFACGVVCRVEGIERGYMILPLSCDLQELMADVKVVLARL